MNNTFRVGKDPKTGKIKLYQGRDGKVYDVFEKNILLFHDAPDDPKPFTVIYYDPSKNIFQGGYMNEEEFEKVQKEFGPVHFFDPNVKTSNNLN